MAITFPTTLDSFTNPTASTIRSATGGQSVAATVTDIQDAVEALEAKVGVDSSAVATSHDYKLANLAVGDITDLTATAAELNILDGATLDVNELNILDGVTATTAELNILDGVTATAAELNILDGVTSTTAELNKLDGITGDVVDTGSAQTITGAKALNGGWSSTGQETAGVRRVATQTIGTGAFTPISFDTEDWDQGSLFAPTSSTLNLPAGTWAIHGRIQWAGSAVGERILRYYVNSGGTSYGYSRIAPTSFGPYQVSSTIIKQDSAFTLQMYGYQSSGGDLTATAELQVARLF